MSDPYRAVISWDAFQLLSGIPSAKRAAIGRFVDHLDRNPFDEGDYQETDDTGRAISVKLVDGCAVNYGPDHGAREVCILCLSRAD